MRTPRGLSKTVWLLALLTLALAACNMPGGQPRGDAQATAAALTVAAELTNSAAQPSLEPATATPPPPTNTPAATATEAPPSATPEPTGCTNKAEFVTDVTIPDDTYMDPGETFTKTWRLRNAGTCSWNSEYDLVFSSGKAMGGPASVPIGGNVPPNSTVDVSVSLTAPATDGTHKGNWMLRDDEDRVFGIGANADVAFWVQIRVGPTPTPKPEIYSTNKGDLKSSFHVDLDDGDFDPSSGDRDVWYHAVSANEKYLDPENGARLAVWGSSVPSYDDCSDEADLSGDDISFDDFSAGDYICFRTNENRYGWIEVEALSGSPPETLKIDIRVWKKQ